MYVHWTLHVVCLTYNVKDDAIAATTHLSDILDNTCKQPTTGKSVSWRVHPRNFARNSPTRKHANGAETFSAGWYAQGHNVSLARLYILACNIYIRKNIIQRLTDQLLASCSLRDRENRDATTSWLADTTEYEIYMNMILFLVHPDLHRIGSTILERLRGLDETKDIASLWTSCFTGIAVISNRKTPSHTDSNGRPEWYDLLSVKGTNSRPARLEFKELGVKLVYGPGTVVGACGQVFEHSVEFWGEGDRICYARFMRDKVRERFGVDPGSWVKQDLYSASLSRTFCKDRNFVC
jgi:hypothetical protein